MTQTDNQHDGLVRILFELDTSDWHGHGSERLWAEPVAGSDSNDIYRIKNSPFFFRGINLMDLVRAVPSEEEPGILIATSIVEWGGHSTYMVISKVSHEKFNEHWKELEKLGCSYESGSVNLSSGLEALYSVDVPPTTNIHDAYSVLSSGETKGIWVFQEGCVGPQLRAASPST